MPASLGPIAILTTFTQRSNSLCCYVIVVLLVVGKCLSRFTNKKTPYCVRFNPDDDKQHLFVVGCSDKKIYTVSIFIVHNHALIIHCSLKVTGVLEGVESLTTLGLTLFPYLRNNGMGPVCPLCWGNIESMILL